MNFKEKLYFNLGNATYKYALDKLGDNWRSENVDKHLLDEAISLLHESVDSYKSVLKINSANSFAKDNKRVVEDLLKILNKKKEMQQHEQRNSEKNCNNKNESD